MLSELWSGRPLAGCLWLWYPRKAAAVEASTVRARAATGTQRFFLAGGVAMARWLLPRAKGLESNHQRTGFPTASRSPTRVCSVRFRLALAHHRARPCAYPERGSDHPPRVCHLLRVRKGRPSNSIPTDAGAPLLCAGVVAYVVLENFKLQKKRVGVLGLSDLGHIAIKLAKAMERHVTVSSASPAKKKEAIEHLGVDAFLVSQDAEAMEDVAGSLDGILEFVPVALDLSVHPPLLDDDGHFIYLGLPSSTTALVHAPLIFHRIRITGSAAGSIRETQGTLDFCGERSIACAVEFMQADRINQATERLKTHDVRYRFVVDVGASRERTACERENERFAGPIGSHPSQMNRRSSFRSSRSDSSTGVTKVVLQCRSTPVQGSHCSHVTSWRAVFGGLRESGQ